MKNCKEHNRRQFLTQSGQFAIGLGLFGLSTQSLTREAVEPYRSIRLENLHTGELDTITFWVDGQYSSEGIDLYRKLVRDHYQDETGPVDLELIELLYKIQSQVGGHKNLQVISGYRSERTNAVLRQATNGVAKKSLHTLGKAVDIRVPGLSTQNLYKLGRSLKFGGVGKYPSSGFVHLDTGRIRFWG